MAAPSLPEWTEDDRVASTLSLGTSRKSLAHLSSFSSLASVFPLKNTLPPHSLVLGAELAREPSLAEALTRKVKIRFPRNNRIWAFGAGTWELGPTWEWAAGMAAGRLWVGMCLRGQVISREKGAWPGLP